MNAQPQVRSHRNVIAGIIFIAIAAAFGVGALNYEPGTPLRMGPGFIPLTLAGILAALGLFIAVSGLRGHETVEPTPVAWRGIALVLLSLAIFGAFARQLGLVPVVFICTALTALASRNNTIVSALIIAGCMAALCYLVFKTGLGIALPTFGSLFPF